ncbi:MAG: PLP-dependent aminotransferase family protein [Clostridiales bacterium]|nr:PLP-dependent aminotransferase family protein [Clostridiales bacterium]
MWKIDEKIATPLYVQLYTQIKADILNGTLKAGTKLRSSRAISTEMCISRNTANLAYDSLFAEGLISSQPRIGYYVENLDIGTCQQSHASACKCGVYDCTCDCKGCTCNNSNNSEAGSAPEQNIIYDFQYGKLLNYELPCNVWHRLIGRCLREYREDIDWKKNFFGEFGLRTEIQKYISTYRDVNCSAEQIVITTGTQFCLDIVCRLLKFLNKDRGMRRGIAMEEPGYDQSRVILENNDLRIYPMELDQHGAAVKSIAGAEAIAAYVTPSHQFPTGIVMPLSRRQELSEWANGKNAFIIEDDYNCHFQHGVRPLPAIQSLCPDRVFYIGGFSELFPCINVSYMVVPQTMLGLLHKLYDNYAPFTSFLTQKSLEMFMREGYWESHLRKMRKNQKIKCEALISALKNKFGDSIHISGFQAGLHLLVHARWNIKEDELISRAYQAGVGVYPVSKYWANPQKREDKTVLLNYGGISPQDIPVAVDLLYNAWCKK